MSKATRAALTRVVSETQHGPLLTDGAIKQCRDALQADDLAHFEALVEAGEKPEDLHLKFDGFQYALIMRQFKNCKVRISIEKVEDEEAKPRAST